MKNLANKPKVVFIGRFNKSEILSGPEKFAKRIAQKHSQINETQFIEYFFDGNIYGIKDKLFGKETDKYGNIEIIKLGILRLFFELFKKIERHASWSLLHDVISSFLAFSKSNSFITRATI